MTFRFVLLPSASLICSLVNIRMSKMQPLLSSSSITSKVQATLISHLKNCYNLLIGLIGPPTSSLTPLQSIFGWNVFILNEWMKDFCYNIGLIMLLLRSITLVAFHLTKIKVRSPFSCSVVREAPLWPHFLPFVQAVYYITAFLSWPPYNCSHFLSTPPQNLPLLCMAFLASFRSPFSVQMPHFGGVSLPHYKKQQFASTLSSSSPMVFKWPICSLCQYFFLFKIIHETIKIQQTFYKRNSK